MTQYPRALAAKILQRCLAEKRPLHFLIDQAKSENPNLAWGYLQALCFGVMRYYPRLEWILSHHIKKPLKKKDEVIQCLLYIGIYDLFYMNTPEYASLKETVEACIALKREWAKGLCNAILRQLQEEKHAKQLDFEKDIAAKTMHPKWMIGLFKKAWPNHWSDICVANNSQAPMTLRVHRPTQNRDKYLKSLTEAGIKATPLATPESVMLQEPLDVQKLPGFTQGLVSIQDGAGQFAAHLLELAPHLRVLDACAAPGGKTCHILELESHLGSLLALEVSAPRLALLKQNLERLNLNATLCQMDATTALNEPDGWFDRILLDAPCSATGIIRRQPDVKQLRTYEDILELIQLQEQLLENLWPKLKPGGLLLYATCSIVPMENVQQIENFCSRHPDAQALEFSLPFGHRQNKGWQILPGEGNMDGFYYAKLRKKS